MPNQQTTPTAKFIAKAYESKQTLDKAELAVSRDKFAKRLVIRQQFETEIEPKIREQLSLVELDKDGEPIEPDYVKQSESVRAKAAKRMLGVMAKTIRS